jgi:hypothetical protein
MSRINVALAIWLFAFIGCNFQSDSTVVPINVPFEVTQETVLQGELQVIAVRVKVESDGDIILVIDRNGEEIDSCSLECREWLVVSNDFQVGDHVVVDLRVGEIYRDTYCIILK